MVDTVEIDREGRSRRTAGKQGEGGEQFCERSRGWVRARVGRHEGRGEIVGVCLLGEPRRKMLMFPIEINRINSV